MSDSAGKLDITTFLLSAIHDMKNSLGVMSSYLEEALALDGADAPARTRTARALYEAQRVNDHLIQLLALYKIDQAFYPFDPEHHCLADLTEEALARVAVLAESAGIELDGECPDTAYGWFDYELVFGVVVQALRNALHYARARVRLEVQSVGAGVRILVDDDGPGFPDFLLEHGNAARLGIHHQSGGTGLGLYFASVVAGLHRGGGDNRAASGAIRLENGGSLGGGRFILELP